MTNHQDAGRHIDDDEARAGELCPICRYFNSPPADDTCEHLAAWTWDGQVEPLGAGQPFAREWSTFAELASGAEEDSTDGIVLRAHARRNALRAELIAHAGQGVPLGQVLERVAQAEPGEGWSSGGVLGGSGHGWYVRDPKRLDELAAHCVALHEACTQLVVEVGEGGTGGLQVAVPTDELTWELATGGRWEEDVYHSGYINYYVAGLGGGRWLMRSVQRNGELDHVTQEDVDKGHLNDDQIQAMAVQVVREHLERQGFELMSWQGNPEVDPSIWFIGKSGRPEWVVVRAYVFPQTEPGRPANWGDIATGCSHLSTTGHFAPVGISGVDQWLDADDNATRPHRGHRLHVAFEGLE